MPKLTDVLIVTATDVESRAVLSSFKSAIGSPSIPTTVNNQLYHDLGKINGARVFLASSEMGTGGPGGSQESVRQALVDLEPDATFMVGIAFGVDATKQKIGDVLVSKQLCPYESQRVGAEVVYRGDKPHAAPRLLNWCRGSVFYWKKKSAVQFGVVLTGEKLIDDVDYLDSLKSIEPEAIGGEMEGAGLYVSCDAAKVDWILVKAICDWADGNKNNPMKKKHQATAAANAADFVLLVLQTVKFKSSKASPAAIVGNHQTTTVDLIAAWVQNVLEVKVGWRRAMDGNTPWPGESLALVTEESAQFAGILGRLDPHLEREARLTEAIHTFRESEDTMSWSTRRDSLMALVASTLRG